MVMAEAKEEQPQLLLDTLNRLWSHYLQASDCEPDDNQAASVKVCVNLGYRPLFLSPPLALCRNTGCGCCSITFSTWMSRPCKMRTSIGMWKKPAWLDCTHSSTHLFSSPATLISCQRSCVSIYWSRSIRSSAQLSRSWKRRRERSP